MSELFLKNISTLGVAIPQTGDKSSIGLIVVAAIALVGIIVIAIMSMYKKGK